MAADRKKNTLSEQFAHKASSHPLPVEPAQRELEACQVLQGDLSQKPIAWLLRAAQHFEVTGILLVGSAACSVSVQFGLGRAVHAHHPLCAGAEAIMDLFIWEDGRVRFEPGKLPQSASIQETTEELLIRGEAYLDNLEFLKEHGINEMSFLMRPSERLADGELMQRLSRGRKISLDVQSEFYSSIYGTRNLKDAAERMSLQRSQWVSIAANLLQLGLLLNPAGDSLKLAKYSLMPQMPQVTPVAGTPVVEMPVAEMPVAEMPVAGTPVVEMPVAEMPVAGTPVAEMPVAGTPVVGTPVVGTPVVGTPVVGTPVAEAPVVGTPVAGTPVAGTPVAEMPVAGTPVVGTPVAETPVAEMPVAGTPVAETSTRTAEQVTPVTETSTRTAEQVTPVGETSTRTAEQVTPVGETSTRTAEQVTPVAETSTRTAEQVTPVTETSTRTAEQVTAVTETTTRTAEQVTPVAETSPRAPDQGAPVEAKVDLGSIPANMVKLGVPDQIVSLDPARRDSVLQSLRRPDTGILSFDALNFFLEREFARAYRLRAILSLVLFCARLNQSQDQLVPPNVSLALTTAVSRIVNDQGIFGHFGDCAFAIVLPDLDKNQACGLADKICSDLPWLAPELGPYKPFLHFGIGCVPSDATDLPKLVHATQSSLFDAFARRVARG